MHTFGKKPVLAQFRVENLDRLSLGLAEAL
jgi:hypothetical protein